MVQMGIIQSRLPASDLILIESEEEEVKPVRKAVTIPGGISRASNFSPEINLLGKTVDEAISELDKFLDNALLSHASSVTIIHGKGTGALRKGIHDYLKKHPSVRTYRQGAFGEGDAGVTIVEF